MYCDHGVLQDRVVSPDREAFQKLRSVQGLEEALERWDFFTPMPDSDTRSIDNTALDPTEAAVQIVAHFGLETQKSG
ncbi:MAG: hypothetical protein JW934_06205 [Anaerolineae bacterium]|nr:hypothetical protein [Anaerolineae bacterium]